MPSSTAPRVLGGDPLPLVIPAAATGETNDVATYLLCQRLPSTAFISAHFKNSSVALRPASFIRSSVPATLPLSRASPCRTFPSTSDGIVTSVLTYADATPPSSPRHQTATVALPRPGSFHGLYRGDLGPENQISCLPRRLMPIREPDSSLLTYPIGLPDIAPFENATVTWYSNRFCLGAPEQTR
jgi:hypothetical protein